MRRWMVVVLGLALVVGVTASHGQWKMHVHEGGSVTEFTVSDIDSLTFYEDTMFVVPAMVVVPAGVFIMGDGAAYCGMDEHEVTLTRGLYLGQHEVTNQEYLEAVQWAYDHGHVNADPTSVWDNLDGSSQQLLDLDDVHCEIQFDGAGSFYLRERKVFPSRLFLMLQ